MTLKSHKEGLYLKGWEMRDWENTLRDVIAWLCIFSYILKDLLDRNDSSGVNVSKLASLISAMVTSPEAVRGKLPLNKSYYRDTR